MPDKWQAADQRAKGQRDNECKRKATRDAAARGPQNMQRLAVGIVIDSAEGEIPELEPDLVKRRDQAARPADCGNMPDRRHRRGKSDRQQDGPHARPPNRHP